MRRIAGLLVAAGVALGANTAAATTGPGFSSPVRLPTGDSEWSFAVNNQGQAVGVYVSSAGAVIIELTPSGGLGRSWLMPLPAHVGEAFSPAAALGDNGDVAVAVRYLDGQQEGCHEEHCAGPCCARVAIASWKLGAAPPLAQTVSPHLLAASEAGQQPGLPRVVIGRDGHVTALWTRGPANGESRGDVEDAFGQVGGTLHTQRLLSAPHGVQLEDLHLAPNGSAVASWLDYGTGPQTASEAPRGGLRPPAQPGRVPAMVEALGFSHDYAGDTIFAFRTDQLYTPSRLEVMVSHNGRRFRSPHVVAQLPELAGPTVFAGGDRSILAIWGAEHGHVEHRFARRDSVSGSLGRTVEIERGFRLSTILGGFIDSRDRSLIIYQRPVNNRFETFEVDALLAQPGRLFGGRVRVASNLHNCTISVGEFDEPPIANSPNGQAVFDLTCEEFEEGPNAGQYLVRYTP